MPALTLLGRPGCHLCHEMRAVVGGVLGAAATLVERNIEEDEELLRRYALLIPVLLAGDVEVARYRIGPEELRRRLSELGLF